MNRAVHRPVASHPSVIATREPINWANVRLGLYVGLVLLAAYAIKIAH